MTLIQPSWIERRTPRQIALMCGLGLILLAVLLWAYCGGGPSEVPYITNIGISEGKNAIQTNLIVHQEQVLKNAEIKANQANANLVNSQLRDSNTFSGRSTDADNEFCSRWPNDSSCTEWLRQRK